MAVFSPGLRSVEEPREKGLKTGALGLVSSVVMGVASTAPAYSLAATLFFVVAAVGLKSPLVAVLAFVPMLLCSVGFSELNKSDPDCGTTFIWGARAFGPKTGWAGGWAVVAADVLVMASLAQVAGQYLFFFIQGPNSAIGKNASGGWVLLVGVLWIAAMTYICYRGIEVSARFQKVLLSIEISILLVLSLTALVRVYGTHPPPGSLHPSLSWLSPSHLPVSAFVSGLILMLFIYWGWDTALSVNEETADKSRTRGRADESCAPVRRAVGHRGCGLRHLRVRHGPVPASDPHGAQLGRRLDPDHDPAERTHDAVDGRLRGAARVVRQDPPQVPDPDGVHCRDGRCLDRPVHPAELHLRRQPYRRRGHRDRPVHRVLLRADGVLLCLVLPGHADQQRLESVDARHPARGRRADHVRGWLLQPAERLGRVQQLHHVGAAGPALADRRYLHRRGAGRAGRSDQLCLHARHRPRLLPQGNAQPGHSRARL